MSEDVNTQQEVRLEKLRAIQQERNAFPNDFRPSSHSCELFALHDPKDKPTLAAEQHTTTIAGRIMLKRLMGKASFIQLQDRTGKIQVYVKKNDVSEQAWEEFLTWDMGDIIGCSGIIFKTNTGELSVHAHSIRLLTKSLRPLPDKYHGLNEKELCYRQRYVDLIVNEHSRRVFVMRSEIIQVIREFFLHHDFMEVETPMMQVIPGGAAARPFTTHHNALDIDLYLRIAPELYLKRLVVGGFERVFEINRNFRNEGLSTKHNPEFTMIEFYQAYADYIQLMDMTEVLLRKICDKVLNTQLINYQEHSIDFSKPFARHTVAQSLVEYNTELNIDIVQDLIKLSTWANQQELNIPEFSDLGNLQFAIFEATVEHKLIQPTFITAYPTAVSPLARKNEQDINVTDRFELFIGGRELANGFSELNDSIDQAERFHQQVAAKEAGDEEAMHYDADFIRALEYGMPPTAGEGIGVDRLVMLLTDSASIKDVILFPHMRPAGHKQ